MARFDAVVSDLAAAQRELADAIAENTQALSEAARAPSADAPGGGLPGGRGGDDGGAPQVAALPGRRGRGPGQGPGALFAARLSSAGAGLVAVSAAALGKGIAGGLQNVAEGGTFTGGVADSFNRMVAKVPLLGEISGVASGVRVQDRVTQRAQGILGELAARGAKFTKEERGLLVNEILAQEEAREQSNREVRAQIVDTMNERRKRGEGFRGVSSEDVKAAIAYTSLSGLALAAGEKYFK